MCILIISHQNTIFRREGRESHQPRFYYRQLTKICYRTFILLVLKTITSTTLDINCSYWIQIFISYKSVFKTKRKKVVSCPFQLSWQEIMLALLFTSLLPLNNNSNVETLFVYAPLSVCSDDNRLDNHLF